MGTKTISISDDAYLRLSRLKGPNESFSQAIQRLTGRGDLMRYAGAISQEFADELMAASREIRARATAERDARMGRAVP